MESEPALPNSPKVRDDIAMVEIDGEAVLFDGRDLVLHHLNSAAAIVFQLCDGSGTVDELARDIAEAAGAPFEQVRGEVADVVESFARIGILVGSEPVHEHEHHHDHSHGEEGAGG